MTQYVKKTDLSDVRVCTVCGASFTITTGFAWKRTVCYNKACETLRIRTNRVKYNQKYGDRVVRVRLRAKQESPGTVRKPGLRPCRSFELTGHRHIECDGFIHNGNHLFCGYCHHYVSVLDSGSIPIGSFHVSARRRDV
jgi:hypothetical protein